MGSEMCIRDRYYLARYYGSLQAVPTIRLYVFPCLWKASLRRGALVPETSLAQTGKRELRGLLQLKTHENPVPLTVPVPMADRGRLAFLYHSFCTYIEA